MARLGAISDRVGVGPRGAIVGGSEDPDTLLALWHRWVERTNGNPEAHAASGAAPIFLDAGASEAGWHEVEVFLTCPRLYELLIENRRRRAEEAERLGFPKGLVQRAMDRNEAPALVRGSLIHVYVGHYLARWAAEDGGFPYRWSTGWEVTSSGARVCRYAERVVASNKEIVEPEIAVRLLAGKMLAEGYTPQLITRELDVTLRAVAAWRTQMPGLLAGHRILGVERPVTADIKVATGTKRLSARLDFVIQERRTGTVFVEDHKSSLVPELALIKKLYSISGQLALQRAFGIREYGPKFGGIRINVIGVDDRNTMLHRVLLPQAAEAAYTVARSAAWAHEQIATCRTNNFFPPIYAPYICSKRSNGKPCDGYELCMMGPGAAEIK